MTQSLCPMREGRVLLEPPAGWNPSWLTSDISQKIISALGKENVRFVGGAVRDSLLGQTAADIDMATTHSPEKVCELLRGQGIKALETGMQHGTVTAVWKRHSCEITTLRRDVETDGRHATVAFTDDWQEDAKRRDFTINALYATADGEIFDPFGGLEDLRNNRVRFIGDAETRIREDALRIYRFFRFSARFNAELDQEGLAACRARAADVSGLSRERVRDELLKLLTAPRALYYVCALNDIAGLPSIEHMAASVEQLTHHVNQELKTGRQTSAVTRLSSLYCAVSPKALARYFRLSRKQEKFVVDVREASQCLSDKKSLNELLYQFGQKVVLEALSISLVPETDTCFATAEQWVRPIFPVDGESLISLGFEPGEQLGRHLKAMEARWIASDFSLSKDELTAGLAEK